MSVHGKFSRVAMAGAFISLIAFTVQEAEARGRGGGARGGGATSVSRGGGGGGGLSRGGVSSNRGSGFSRGGSYSRPSGGYSKPSTGFGGSGGGRAGASQLPSTGNRAGSGTAGQRPSTKPVQRPGAGTGQRPGTGTGQRPGQGGNRPGGGNNINTGNINTGDVNINVDRDYHYHNDWDGWGGWYDHPIGAGIAIGAMAGFTAAVIGSAYFALPAGCSPYLWNAYNYYRCGPNWYAPRYEGDTVVYIVVTDPTR